MSEKKLFLLDAYALIYRAHYAFIKRPLLNAAGQNVSAITGFFNTLLEVLQQQQPTHLGVAFDLSGPTFRHDLASDYKANRAEQPEDITWSVPIILELLQSMGIPTPSLQGYEADDVIGTLAKQAQAQGYEVYMMTPDKDYGQLVGEGIYLYKPARTGNEAEIWDSNKVCETWAIQKVEQVIDMLALQGDTADNIAGVKGIGPKAAAELLGQFPSLELLLANLDKLKPRWAKLLEESREQALLAKKLATIALDLPLSFEAQAYDCKTWQIQAALPKLKELGFNQLYKRLANWGQAKTQDQPTNPPPQGLFAQEISESSDAPSSPYDNLQTRPHDYHILSPQDLPQFLTTLLAQDLVCFDTETTGLQLDQAQAVGLAFCFQTAQAYYLPLPYENRAQTQSLLQSLQAFWQAEHIAKIGQNLKFDLLLLRHYGIEVRGQLWDTMLMHYLLEPEQRHGMDYLARNLLNYQTKPIDDLLQGRQHMGQVPLNEIAEYAAEDADITWCLYQNLKTQLQEPLLQVYLELEAPLIPVLVEMEYWGICLDAKFLQDYAQVLQAERQTLQEKILQLAKQDFNLDSPKQVGEVLFDTLKLPYKGRKTKVGHYVTNEEKLSELQDQHEIIPLLLDYRRLSKLLSTYVLALPQLISPVTGRLHTSYNQGLTATGRLSSQQPNLQNIPIKTEQGREIRKAFVPQAQGDWILMAADYSQIELRLMAALSQDEQMLQAFQLREDIHARTAARIFQTELEQVSKAQRYQAKTINFSIIYGAGARNIAQNLNIKPAQASQLIKAYFEEFSGIKTYMENVVSQARELGYVQTIKGRRRYLRDLQSRNQLARSHAERNAVNTPIQGSAADLIKLAMIRTHRAIKKQGLQARILLQVHDELVLELPRTELPAVQALLQEAMCQALPELNIPLEIGLETGQNWLEAH